jgi:hypothetical protein
MPIIHGVIGFRQPSTGGGAGTPISVTIPSGVVGIDVLTSGVVTVAVLTPTITLDIETGVVEVVDV